MPYRPSKTTLSLLLFASDVAHGTTPTSETDPDFDDYFDYWMKDNNICATTQDENKMTPLLACAAEGSLLGIKKLLARGACINEQDKNGNTLLHYAFSMQGATNGQGGDNKEVIDWAQAQGLDIYKTNNKGQTPLFGIWLALNAEFDLFDETDCLYAKDHVEKMIQTYKHINGSVGQLDDKGNDALGSGETENPKAYARLHRVLSPLQSLLLKDKITNSVSAQLATAHQFPRKKL